MKAVDVQKVRTAILYLQSAGAKESAQAVWDLLDDYVSQRPNPLVMKSYTTARGASAAANAPMCEVDRWNFSTPDCYRMGIGTMVNTGSDLSVLMCRQHAAEFERDGAQFTQTFFGDENSAADVAEHAARYAD